MDSYWGVKAIQVKAKPASLASLLLFRLAQQLTSHFPDALSVRCFLVFLQIFFFTIFLSIIKKCPHCLFDIVRFGDLLIFLFINEPNDSFFACSKIMISDGQMSELVNQKSSVQGKVPSGYFNALFDLSGAWLDDAKDTKNLAFDGYFISLYNLHLKASPLVLREEVKRAVPPKWDPVALSR